MKAIPFIFKAAQSWESRYDCFPSLLFGHSSGETDLLHPSLPIQ